MPKLAAATFLKLMSSRPDQILRDLSAYEKPGGYDAHRNLRLAIARGTADGTIERLHAELDAISVIDERKRALVMEPTIRKKLLEQGDVFLDAPGTIWHSPKGHFSVDLQPDVGIQRGNHRVFAFLYFHAAVRPTPTTAGALIHLAREQLDIDEGDEVAVIDVRDPTTYKAVMGLSPLLVEKTVRELDAWFGGRSR